jgi:hypothetical protein
MTDNTHYRLPADQKSGPNCGPTSVAVLAGVPLADVMAYIKANTKGKGPRWKGATTNPKFPKKIASTDQIERIKRGDLFKALQHFGLNPEVEQDLNFMNRNKRLSSVAGGFLNLAFGLKSDKSYLILTGSHAQAVAGGRIFDQNTPPEGAKPSTAPKRHPRYNELVKSGEIFWGANKKVALIITCDKRKEDTMPKSSPVVAVLPTSSVMGLAASFIAEQEGIAMKAKGSAKELSKAASGAKITAYGHVIATLIIGSIAKGSKKAGEFRAALQEAGVSKASVKRYAEIGQAARGLKIVKGVRDFNDTLPKAITQALLDEGINTEDKLKKLCFPTAEKTLVEQLVEAATKGTETENEAVQALLDAAAKINPAAQDVADTLVNAMAA